MDHPADVGVEMARMGRGDHICLIYETFGEQVAALLPFLSQGLERNERCLYIVDEHTAEEVAEALREEGIDVDAEVARGALRFATQRESYLRGGEFVPEAMIEALRALEAEAVAEGYAGLRVTGEMTWALGPELGCDRLIEYEALLNRFFPGSRSMAVCQYNRTRFPPEVIDDVLATHPTAVVGDVVVDNLYYQPPEGFLNGWGPAERVDWKLAQLRRSHGLFQQLREAKEEAETASRAKSQFLAVMSHELRTPLNAAVGFADLLAKGVAGPLTERQEDYVGRIKGSAHLLIQLVDEILSLSRIEANKETLRPEEVELAEVVERALELVAPVAAGKPLELRHTRPPGPIRLTTDPTKLEQVILNLLSNAVKFTSEGEVEVVARRGGGEAVVEVRDTGPGIPAEELPRLFEPFWQSDQSSTRTTGGTGLGLTVSRRLARILGGELEVESEVGRGSTFTLRIPLEPPPP